MGRDVNDWTQAKVDGHGWALALVAVDPDGSALGSGSGAVGSVRERGDLPQVQLPNGKWVTLVTMLNPDGTPIAFGGGGGGSSISGGGGSVALDPATGKVTISGPAGWAINVYPDGEIDIQHTGLFEIINDPSWSGLQIQDSGVAILQGGLPSSDLTQPSSIQIGVDGTMTFMTNGVSRLVIGPTGTISFVGPFLPPSADPHVIGALWNDGGVPSISAG